MPAPYSEKCFELRYAEGELEGKGQQMIDYGAVFIYGVDALLLINAVRLHFVVKKAEPGKRDAEARH